MTYPANEVLLRCACGNRDSMGVSLPPCSADCGRTMELEVKATGLTAAEATHRDALEQIVNSPHCQYAGSDQYAIGVADGHRCAADLARAALSGGSAVAATARCDAHGWACPTCHGESVGAATEAALREALADLVEGGACELHGGGNYCLTHSEKLPCPHKRGQEILALSEPRNVSPTDTLPVERTDDVRGYDGD